MKRRDWIGLAFVSPWLIGFLVFTLGPFLTSVYLSFTRYDVVSTPVWVGAANYRALLTDDPTFWKSLWVTIRYGLVAVPLGTIAAVGLAILLNLPVKGMSAFRTLFYLPSIVPTVATSTVFLWLLNPQLGLINTTLRRVGIEGPAWLVDPKWAPWTFVGMALYTVGGSMVIYLAGLKDIPAHLYEAAILDGAGGWKRLRLVTLPLLTPVIFFNVVMGVIGSFQVFTQAFILTNGGPEDSTMFYALYLYFRAWYYGDMGYASAMAWILFLLVVIVTSLLFASRRRWVHYGEGGA